MRSHAHSHHPDPQLLACNPFDGALVSGDYVESESESDDDVDLDVPLATLTVDAVHTGLPVRPRDKQWRRGTVAGVLRPLTAMGAPVWLADTRWMDSNVTTPPGAHTLWLWPRYTRSVVGSIR